MPSLDPPVPLTAVINVPNGEVIVTFNHPLQQGFFDTGNWFVRWANNSRPVVGVEVEPGGESFITVFFGLPVLNIGPDVVTYSPPPFDIVSDTARPTPAAAFTDFPLT